MLLLKEPDALLSIKAPVETCVQANTFRARLFVAVRHIASSRMPQTKSVILDICRMLRRAWI